MAENFLSRWSHRKQAQRAGQVLAEPPVPPTTLTDTALAPATDNAATLPGSTGASDAGVADPAPAPPTMDDVAKLTPQSDFKTFVARDVAPEVRNAALKKLFADPHFNVMDRLDTYIDDYSLADPLPPSMLRQMASAKFLGLFDGDEAQAGAVGATLGDDADTAPLDSVAQSAAIPPTGADCLTQSQPDVPDPDHDHTDLRLQPDDAAPAARPGRGAA